MDSFLKTVAGDLYNSFGNQISNITLLFPNRRASLFFTKYLSELIDNPIWQPKVSTINDLMFTVANVKPADPLLLNFNLYNQYIKITNSQESFDEFFFWGNVMISDFDQVDKYLVDPSKIFANIKDLKEIDKRFDEFNEEHLKALQDFLNLFNDSINSTIRSRYSQIWEKLGAIYTSFRDGLLNENIAYEGLAYRLASEKLNTATNSLIDGTFAVIGFNALNTCEKVFFHHIQRFNNALFYWDYDKYYLQGNNSQNEAAMFMGDNLKEFPNKLSSVHFDNFTKNKNINLVASPSNVAQAKLIPDIISKIDKSANNIGINTAIVLPEEQLLLPVLSALPESLQNINVTMGYPIKDTGAYSLVDNLFSLQANFRSNESGQRFYYRDVQNLLTHPYIKEIEGDTSEKLMNEITSRKLITIESSLLSQTPLLSKIFTAIPNGKNLIEYFLDIVKTIAQKLDSLDDSNTTSKFELEFLLTIFKALNRLNDILGNININISHKTLRALYRKAMAEQRVSFKGEPLSGLQLMGFLETRTLDFENVVILSANDSVLPGVTHKPSFITPSLRFAYGLPDYRHQNAIYAYYFYRLIQRAHNVYLVYTDKAEATRSGEMSRYILQLLMESGIDIKKINVKFDLGLTPEPKISIKKTEKVLSILHKYIDANSDNKYLSPTALSNYKNCKLRFFYSKVANIQEPEEMEESMDERGVGTVFHRAAELIYQQIDKEVTTTQIDLILNDKSLIDIKVNEAFAEIYQLNLEKLNNEITGRNALILERVKWMVRGMLNVDKNRTPYSIEHAEQEYIHFLPININGKTENVRVGGRIDRIEKFHNTTRIVDFKTGSFDEKKVKFEKVLDLMDNKDKDGIFQIFTYGLIYSQLFNIGPSALVPNLWFVRNNGNNYTPVIFRTTEKRSEKIEINSMEPFFPNFYDDLVKLVSEIYDPSIEFTQTDKIDNCRICPYNLICGKGID